MNTVKFRIWNTKIKQWKGFTTDEAYANRCAHFCHKVKDGIFTLSLPEHLIYQRFIGSLDKNKREIFEGDILKFTIVVPLGLCYQEEFEAWEKDGRKPQIFYWEIKWRNANSYFDKGNEMWYRKENNWEVAGNIFENPELLK